jgi:hypothetical protein
LTGSVKGLQGSLAWTCPACERRQSQLRNDGSDIGSNDVFETNDNSVGEEAIEPNNMEDFDTEEHEIGQFLL